MINILSEQWDGRREKRVIRTGVAHIEHTSPADRWNLEALSFPCRIQNRGKIEWLVLLLLSVDGRIAGAINEYENTGKSSGANGIRRSIFQEQWLTESMQL